MAEIIIIGGGLAGSEAAWQAAERGIEVKLYEMRPVKETGAHLSGELAELVCSNSLGSLLVDRASGLLKEEVRRLGSLLLDCAEETALPAGGALAVDREAFSRRVTERIQAHPRIDIIREEMPHIPDQPAIIASGPLTSPDLAQAIQELTGHEHLFFYDAIAPVVQRETINNTIAFRASRYDQGGQQEGDYINCPLNKEEYAAFVDELIRAERIPLRWFEQPINQGVTAGAGNFFEGCLPIEVLAARGLDSLAFGPMRPVGLKDPRTNRWPHAVVQLRQDNLAGSLYNLVGFQTNLTYSEQKRVLRMIPGLEKAEFLRFGQMHRNTFIASPLVLNPTLQLRQRSDLFFAGQITGVEGYMGNIATGLLAGLNAARLINGEAALTLPEDTILGALLKYITHSALKDFQPMKANFGILPRIPTPAKVKRERSMQYVTRALESLDAWAAANKIELKQSQSGEEG
ncbi:MAG: methylenetetrahydrofolate--tRNA-(uracil(54)-C(5))-methyltransferase (FADH(2)-oxidizing) TrmFO [Anaerolineaceae bacterium]|nr:methylenetetrahydrofolate--tRNA-(uracil(54)-C(5))-methyltransferase (FADH(2)-oxidizing) TrmFO [Anaerolineaceae bacterium]